MEMNAVENKFVLFDETEQFNSSFVNRTHLYPSLVGMQSLPTSQQPVSSIAAYVKSPISKVVHIKKIRYVLNFYSVT
jgi:hypothetical protein